MIFIVNSIAFFADERNTKLALVGGVWRSPDAVHRDTWYVCKQILAMRTNCFVLIEEVCPFEGVCITSAKNTAHLVRGEGKATLSAVLRRIFQFTIKNSE